MPGKSIREVFFEDWMPPIITAVLGGIVVGFLVPYVQHTYLQTQAVQEKRLEVYESLSSSAVIYTSRIRRFRNLGNTPLEEISLGEKSEIEAAFAAARSAADKSHDEILTLIPTALVYFGVESQQAMAAFSDWMLATHILPPGEMPSNEEIYGERDKLLRALRKDVGLNN